MKIHEKLMKGMSNDMTINQQVEICLKNAIRHKLPVKILHNKELGHWLYSVEVVGSMFWLDSFLTEQEAYDYIKAKGLICQSR